MANPSPLRLTVSTLAVLEVLNESTADNPAYGFQICQEADLGPGTVYPILERLDEHGWLDTWQEAEQPPGRPRRRYYTLNKAGHNGLAEALATRAHRRSLLFPPKGTVAEA